MSRPVLRDQAYLGALDVHPSVSRRLKTKTRISEEIEAWLECEMRNGLCPSTASLKRDSEDEL